MIIKLQKGKHGKESTLTCVRSDGSSTWTKMRKGIEVHDIAHWVVETELKFDDAFYGTVEQGFNIEDYEAPRDKRPEELIPGNLSVHAHQTEHIVNLLMIDLFVQSGNMDVMENLKTILKEKNIPFPEELTSKALAGVKKSLAIHAEKWMMLEEGDVLELPFQSKK